MHLIETDHYYLILVVMNVVILLLLIVLAGAQDKEMITLTDDNFDMALSTYKFLFVDFYADWYILNLR